MSHILVTGARAPVALHLARLLHGAGHRVTLADTPARPISAATATADYVRLPPPRFRFADYANALGDLVRARGIDCVLPTCEEIFYLALARENRPEDPGSAFIWPEIPWGGPEGQSPSGGARTRLFAPNMDLLTRAHDKHAFIRLCDGLGLATPETHLLQSTADAAALADRARDLAVKPVWSRFARQVLLRPSPRRMRNLRPSLAAPWIAQQFVAGEEISVYAVAHAGRLKALSAYRGLYRAGKGGSVASAPVTDPEVRRFAETFVAGTGWTGQVSFDLIRRPGGTVLPLECNPRATSGLHFFADPEPFCAALLGDGPEAAPDLAAPQGVRLALWLYGLPQALARGRIGDFRAALRTVREVLDWAGDPGPRKAQLGALAGIAGTALRHRISLQRASTHDIEWNGPDQSSI